MDLYEKMRQLETELYDAKPVPFSKKSAVDTEKCLTLLNEIKRAIPDDVYDINRLADEKKRVIQIAEENLTRINKQAEKMITEAEQRAAVLVDQSSLVHEAEMEADRIKRLALREIEVTELKMQEKLAVLLKDAEKSAVDALREIKEIQAKLGVQIKEN